MMIKKAIVILSACLLLFGCCVPAFAEEAPADEGGALYGGYEDDWLDGDYEELGEANSRFAAENTAPEKQWYQRLSIVPVLIGVLIGAAAVFVLSRRALSDLPNPVPYEPIAETVVTARHDRLARETHTKRSL